MNIPEMSYSYTNNRNDVDSTFGSLNRFNTTYTPQQDPRRQQQQSIPQNQSTESPSMVNKSASLNQQSGAVIPNQQVQQQQVQQQQQQVQQQQVQQQLEQLNSAHNQNALVAALRRERRNKPGQRFGAKKKSWVWNWFVQDSNDSNIAVCDQCGKVITRLPSDKGSPKKLSEHLKTHKLTKDSVNEGKSSQVMTLIDDNFANTSHSTSQTLDSINVTSSSPTKFASTYSSQHRFISGEYDNKPYSPMKFHQDIMKFLTENKLPISVVKSQSFKQLIYDLRSDSINDLKELSTLYSSLIEVSKFDPSQPNDGIINTENQNQSTPNWI